MNETPKRCEPADTNRDGDYYLRSSDGQYKYGRWVSAVKMWQFIAQGWNTRPEELTGYCCLCLAPSPAEIEALTVAARSARDWQQRRVDGQVAVAHSTIDDIVLAALSAALASFQKVRFNGR